jgi:RNA polymerase sigma-32 factor
MISIDTQTQVFIDKAKRAPRLDSELELELISTWQAKGDKKAAERVIEANMRQVVFAALKFRHYGFPVADLISEGSLGLMKALDRFEAGKGARFSTYATYWIRAQIVGLVMGSWSLLSGRSGALHSRTFFRLRRERARLESLHPAEEVPLLLAKHFEVSLSRMHTMLGQLDNRELSLDAQVGTSGQTLMDELSASDDQGGDLERREETDQVKRALGRGLELLDPRERYIVEQRLMADPEEARSLAEIGAHFGVSRERVRQLEERAKGKLKAEVLREFERAESGKQAAA